MKHTCRTRDVERSDPAGGSGTYIFSSILFLDKDTVYGQDACRVKTIIKFRCDERPKKRRKPSSRKGMYGKDKDGNDLIGCLKGHLLRRPHENFHKMAKDRGRRNSELFELASIFCEPDGTASRVKHPSLQEQSPSSIASGGFFHISKVEVNREHQGKDLGLHAVHETLLFLDTDWTLSVMCPLPIKYYTSGCSMGTIDSYGCYCRDKWGDEPDTSQRRRNQRNVMRHFARMGFVQAGQNKKKYDSWFLTPQMYFNSTNIPGSTDEVEAVKRHWVPKTDAEEAMNFYSPMPQHTLVGLNIDLMGAIMDAIECTRDRKKALLDIKDLLVRGATINGARALHRTVVNSVQDDTYVLSALVKLGGDVNFADDDGNRPLHIAASSGYPNVIQFLLESGADIDAVNIEGKKAVDVFLSENFSDIIVKWDTVLSLVPQEDKARLIGGWMSPRMSECLLIKARQDLIDFKELKNGLSEIDHLVYIPDIVLRLYPNGLYKSFKDGYSICFQAIINLLTKQKIPTVRDIEIEIILGPYDVAKFGYFINTGGKIEYALDAVIRKSQEMIISRTTDVVYQGYKEKIEAHPSTPFDHIFDVARFMCIDRGGGSLESFGPYRDMQL